MSADIVLRTQDAVTLRALPPQIVSVGAMGPQGSAGTGGVVARYGVFTDTTTYSAPANVATPVVFNFTEATNGVTIGDAASKIVVAAEGTYSITWSGQFRKVSGGSERITIWVRVNGVNVARTATDVQIAGNNTEQLETINWAFEFQANDFFEIVWSDPNGDVQLLSVAERVDPVRPVVPSSILTVVQVTNEGPGVPVGGTTGQVLAKSSATDYATEWVDRARIVNTDGDPGQTIYVGSVDPDGVYTLAAGDIWIEPSA